MIAYRPHLFLFSPPRISYELLKRPHRFKIPGISRKHVRDNERESSTIIFSPHFDDEVLGAGATILWKRSSLTPVTIAFMTDGTKCPHRVVPPEQFSAIRKKEAIYAARRMGVDDESVIFLNLEEGRLAHNFSQAVQAVMSVLQSNRYTELLIPHEAEPPLWSLDHRATRAIVLKALDILDYQILVREYPVWAMLHFPRLNPFRTPRHELKTVARNTWYQRGGVRLASSLNVAVPFTQELRSSKMHALRAYASQMEEIIPGVNWPTLSKVAGGQFLASFFGRAELFREYVYSPRKHARHTRKDAK